MIVSNKLSADFVYLDATTGYYRPDDVSVKIIFGYCGDCKKMASIPTASAFAASRVQKTGNKDMMVARCAANEKQQKFSTKNEHLMEKYNPKYNSKMMDSIWGLYNRYSPHNFKKNNASVQDLYAEKQQYTSLVSVAQFSIPIVGIETKLELKSSKTARTSIKNWENFWDFPSQQ